MKQRSKEVLQKSMKQADKRSDKNSRDDARKSARDDRISARASASSSQKTTTSTETADDSPVNSPVKRRRVSEASSARRVLESSDEDDEIKVSNAVPIDASLKLKKKSNIPEHGPQSTVLKIHYLQGWLYKVR